MRYFPIYMKVHDKRICVIGNDEPVIAKLRLMMKSDALLEHYGNAPDEDVAEFLSVHKTRITHHNRAFHHSDITDKERPAIAFAYLSAPDKLMMRYLSKAHIPYCVIDNLAESHFTTPAIIDRAPLTIAIGTEGKAPVLARRLKKDLEERLPQSMSVLAKAAGDLRHKIAERLPSAQRRHFWSRFFSLTDNALTEDMAHQQANRLLGAMQEGARQPKPVWFVNASAGDADFLTMQARRLLHEADLVISDADIAKSILELCRREAEFIDARKASDSAKIAQKVRKGLSVVRLYHGHDGIGASGSAAIEYEIRQLEALHIPIHIAANVTARTAIAPLWQASVTGAASCQPTSLN